jgi:glycosyltransferase involved in cell wall biosynthesis
MSLNKILFVSHDGNRAGAQIFLFNIMKHFKSKNFGVVLLILDDWGSFKNDFEDNFETFYFNRSATTSNIAKFKEKIFQKKSSLLQIQEKHKFDLIYVNTIASISLLKNLKATFNVPIVTHIHELAYSIHLYGPSDSYALLNDFSNKIIACSNAVAQNLIFQNPALKSKTEVVHSFIDNSEILEKTKSLEQNFIKDKFNIPATRFLVGTCGNADWRKAPDFFLKTAAESITMDKNIHFVWIGIKEEDPLWYQLNFDAQKMGIANHITWISPTTDAVNIINSLDLFFISSREDPFPLVMLEAALCQKPILGFKNTGGAEEFIKSDAGKLANYGDFDEMAKEIINFKNNPQLILQAGKNAKNKVENLYSFDSSIKKISNILLGAISH